MYCAGKELQFSLVIETVKTITGDIKRDVPSHHGVVHDLSVVRFGTYLALIEGVNIRNVQISAFLHDIRWWDDEEKRIRKIAPQKEGQNFPSATDLLVELKKRKRIDGQSYDDILEAVLTHNKLPDIEIVRPLITRCLADADRLSRFGVGGTLSILDANANYNVPFHNPGSEIVRPEDAPMISFDQIHSCVDDINACIDWVPIMETQSGRDLANHLVQVDRIFLKTFNYRQGLSYDTWRPWLRLVESKQLATHRNLDALLNQKRAQDFRKELFTLEDPELVSEQSFAYFIGIS